MSAFDEIVYGAKKCFDAASVKTNEIIEASKIQIEKSQLNCKLKEEYVRLGKVCYNMSETNVDQTAKMKLIITRIKQILEDIEVANQNFSSNSNKPHVCENCGTTNANKSDFCSKCGNKLV